MNIYISAPITGCSDAECEMKFNKAKNEIIKREHFPVSPWDISKMLPRTFEHSDYLAVDFEVLKRCDAVLFLDGWEESEGCRKERGWCYLLDIDVYDDIREVPHDTVS